MSNTRLSVTIILILWVSLPPRVRACSTHGSVAPTIVWEALGTSNGVVYGVLTLDTFLVPPASTTTCTAGIGLGSLTDPLPFGANVVGLTIVIRNTTTGSYRRLPAFSFAPNSTTSAALAAGSGMSSPPNTNPLFDGSTWFGFFSNVDPFLLPTLEPDESPAFRFNLQIPQGYLPLTLAAQFAGGQGASDGTPDFDGDHPAQYFTAANTLVTLAAPGPTPAPMLSFHVLTLAIIILILVGLRGLTRVT